MTPVLPSDEDEDHDKHDDHADYDSNGRPHNDAHVAARLAVYSHSIVVVIPTAAT